ncbi:MAG: response regulator [Candidatus Latescibacteria bacterium]|nr:response regulator [Candidatus Latescibacterota bacterium]
MTRILVVEDEAAIAKVLVDNLEYEGYQVLASSDGPGGLQQALEGAPDLILLDLVLPGMDGYEICRRLRAAGHSTPVIMLTAKGEEIDKVLGLELGADDYVTKPVGVRELLARIKAVLRRVAPVAEAEEGEVLDFGPARVDFARFQARKEAQSVHMSPKAYGVLQLLWQAQGKALTRAQILEQVWGYEVYPTTRTVDNHIAELRTKLEADPAQPRHILTVHGVGYRFSSQPQQA